MEKRGCREFLLLAKYNNFYAYNSRCPLTVKSKRSNIQSGEAIVCHEQKLPTADYVLVQLPPDTCYRRSLYLTAISSNKPLALGGFFL